MKLKYTLSAILLILNTCLLKGQPICVSQRYTVKDGLVQNNPSQILQDHNGFIWISTWNGLSRFDGREFETFKFDIIDNHHMQKIDNTANGNLWMVSYDRKSLYLYDTQKNQIHNIIQSDEQQLNISLEINELYTLPKGVTWITLRNGGCYRIQDSTYYDGKSIQYIHTVDNTETKEKVYKVREDNKGNEWILSNKGVALYQKQIISNYPFSMIEIIDNLVFLASTSGKLAYFDTDSNQFNTVSLPTDIKKVNEIKVLKNGTLSILTDNGLYTYNSQTKSVKQYTLSIPGHSKSQINKIYQDSKGFVWIFTDAPGIVRLNMENGVRQYLNTPAQYKTTSLENELFIYEDPNQRIWTIPKEGIFSYYDEEDATLKCYFTHNENDKPYRPIIKSHYVDKKKNVWIKSQRSLIKMFFPKADYSYLTLDTDFDTKSVITDTNHNLWIATKKGNIHIMNADKQRIGYLSNDGNLKPDETPFADCGIYALLKSKDNSIWIGSEEDGLYRLTPTTTPYRYKVIHYKNNPHNPYSISSNKVSCLYEDSKGRLWIGTYGGGLNLLEEKEDSARFINARNKLINFPINQTNSIRCIAETLKGAMLVGTIKGLITFSSLFTRYENIHFYLNTSHPGPDALSSSDIMSLLQTSAGSIYSYCYGGGLCKLISNNLLSDQLKFKPYRENTSQLARTMTEDKNGNIWLCSETDITLFNVHEQKFERYGHTFFNRSFNYSECTPAFDKQGNIFVGTEGGILSFAPDHIYKQGYEVPIVITGIKYPKDSLSHILNDIETLEIPTHSRNFTLSFAALDYTNSTDIEYAYQLGDEQWYHLGKKNSVSFVNLPAGEYHFRIKATNGNGIWMKNIKTVNIHVLPTFSETNWAKALYILLFMIVSLFISYIFFYIYSLRHKVNMEQRLAEIKVRSFIDISHELRTPLTLISGPVSEVLSQEPLTARAKKHLQLVQKNTNRMLTLINQVLDFRKIQNKKMKLTIEYINIVALLQNIMDSFRLLATEKNIDFSLQTDCPAVFLWIDGDKFEKIIFNLLSNAFKYTPANQSICINIDEHDKDVSISIADKGAGIQKNKIPQIFERFTTLSQDSDMQPSSGIGLSLVKELVKMMHGEIRVESEIKKGSTFILNLPKGKKQYSKDTNIEYILNDTYDRKGITDQNGTAISGTTSDSDFPETPTKILIVEDNAELREFISDVLSTIYDIKEAEDGISALKEIEKDIPDLIITDIMMPNMDGIQLIKHIKSNIQTCDVPLIILSAKSSLEDRIYGLQLGIDDYIPKPFSADYLKTRITNLITQRKNLQSAFLSRFNARQEKDRNIDEKVSDPQIISLDEAFMQKMTDFMEANYSNDELRVNDLAEYMNMSRTVFYRKVNGIIGISPIEYIKDFRLNKAKYLIKSGMSFSEIAFAVGFSDPNYFGKIFKKEFGMTLTEYKQQCDSGQ